MLGAGPRCVTCGEDLAVRDVGVPMPTICGGDFRTTTPEAAEEIAALAGARFPYAEVKAFHAPAVSFRGEAGDVIHHGTRVEGYADSFNCLEAFEARFAPFTVAVHGHFWRAMPRE